LVYHTLVLLRERASRRRQYSPAFGPAQAVASRSSDRLGLQPANPQRLLSHPHHEVAPVDRRGHGVLGSADTVVVDRQPALRDRPRASPLER